MNSQHEITELLLALERGDQSAREQLMPLVEKELRRLARGYLRNEKKGYWLQTTVLVDDVYLKLIDQKRVHWKNRAHFFGIAAKCMRRILRDYAKAQKRKKRDGEIEHIALSDAPPIPVEEPDDPVDLLALDEALQKLEKRDELQSQIVELRYFVGCTMEEVAEILEVSKTTVEREWSFARAWLGRELGANVGE